MPNLRLRPVMTLRQLLGPEQARTLALATFRRRFGPGWMLIDDRNDDAILAET